MCKEGKPLNVNQPVAFFLAHTPELIIARHFAGMTKNILLLKNYKKNKKNDENYGLKFLTMIIL